jgi:hypothetical protein
MRLSLRRCALVLCAVAACALSACGGGFYFNFGSDLGFGDGSAPDVSLASASTSAAPGQSVHLVAAASDDVGIDSVAFYRVDADADIALGSDGSAPYEWDAPIPAGASGSLQFFAIATDVAGNTTRSASVVVFVAR